MPVLLKTYLISAILLAVILGGCSSVSLQNPFYSTAVVTRADLLSGEILYGDQAKNIVFPDDHVMEINDEMRAYLQRYVPRSYPENTRAKVLAKMIFGKGALGMEYNASKTHTAWDAFRKSEGNCLAFSYLFTVLARERGLKVSFQEVKIPTQWSGGGDDLYHISRHVNVRIEMRNSKDYIFDIDRINFKSHYPTWKISDKHAIALYYSNKGAEYMFASDFDNAFRYLVKALTLEARDAAIWSNLGVLYRMNGIYDYAEKAYFIALKYDGKQKSVLGNLSVLYEHIGEQEKAKYYSALIRKHQMENPYYRYSQALDAFEVGNYSVSLYHLKVAVKIQRFEYKFHDLLGNIYAKLGDETRANNSWGKAKKLQYSQ